MGIMKSSPANYSHQNQYNVSILSVLCKSFGNTFLFGSFLKLIVDCLIFVSPQVLRQVFNSYYFVFRML